MIWFEEFANPGRRTKQGAPRALAVGVSIVDLRAIGVPSTANVVLGQPTTAPTQINGQQALLLPANQVRLLVVQGPWFSGR